MANPPPHPPPPPPGAWPPQYPYPPQDQPPTYYQPWMAQPQYSPPRPPADDHHRGSRQQYQQRPHYSEPPKPCNCLSIRNIPYQLPVEEFTRLYAQFGEIMSSVTNHISDKGIAFVTYYDIRSAMRAVEGMKNYRFEMFNRSPITSFSYKPPDYSRIDLKSTCLKVILRPSRAADHVTVTSVQTEMLRNYGEVASQREVERGQFEVEFYDIRAVKKVLDSSGKIIIDGITYYAEPVIERDEPSHYVRTPTQDRGGYRNSPRNPPQYGMPPPQYQQYPPPQYQQFPPPQYQGSSAPGMTSAPQAPVPGGMPYPQYGQQYQPPAPVSATEADESLKRLANGYYASGH